MASLSGDCTEASLNFLDDHFELTCKRDRLKFNSILHDKLFLSETIEPKLDIRDLTDIKKVEYNNIFLRDIDRKQLIKNYFLRTYKYFL